MKDFDIIIIGSGIGGLVCGDLLSREGYSVCLVEKNRQIGGALQTFVRDRTIFDSGVHYLGGLDKGQTLYQVFKYLGLMEKLQLERMDVNAFDTIFSDGNEEYPFAQGYDRFISRLAERFPGEEGVIRSYCEKMKEVCAKFPLYNLRTSGDEKNEVTQLSAKSFIASLTENRKLREVLAGNNILYAGKGDQTPFYVHALILNSYIESAWKCINGGSQIARILAANIRAQGGLVIRNCEIREIAVQGDKAVSAIPFGGEALRARHFISNLHPARTLEMTQTGLIRNMYRKRLRSLENTVSCFSVNIVLKKQTLPYRSTNYYYHKEGQVWSMADYTEENWPLGYAVFYSAHLGQDQWASSLSILTYMRYEEVSPWTNSFNTEDREQDRGSSYRDFKQKKAAILVDAVEKKIPGLRNAIQTMYTATPLSYRDYLGTEDGSLYGIAKDYKDPVKTLVPMRTKLSNLYFTGQNLNLHGILGATISALLTCSAFVDLDHLIEKIRNA